MRNFITNTKEASINKQDWSVHAQLANIEYIKYVT